MAQTLLEAVPGSFIEAKYVLQAPARSGQGSPQKFVKRSDSEIQRAYDAAVGPPAKKDAAGPPSAPPAPPPPSVPRPASPSLPSPPPSGETPFLQRICRRCDWPDDDLPGEEALVCWHSAGIGLPVSDMLRESRSASQRGEPNSSVNFIEWMASRGAGSSASAGQSDPKPAAKSGSDLDELQKRFDLLKGR